MRFDALTEFLDGLLTDKKIPGFDCCIYHHHKQVYHHSNGYADLESKKPISQNNLYNIYSATKVITCAAALQLFERGKFRLDDPLFLYFPKFKEMYVKAHSKTVKAEIPIRIKDLFCMTAGFNYDLDSSAVRQFKADTNRKCPTILLPDYLAEEPLEFEPSTRWNYSLCHDVLGALIEKITDRKLSEYLSEYMFKPLGMEETGFVADEEESKRMASQYRLNTETGKPENVTLKNGYKLGDAFESGGAGIITSVDDYIKFEEAMVRGNVILRKPTIRLMRLNHLSDEAAKYYWDYSRGHRYGLGVRTIVNQAEACTTAEFGCFGWGGAAGSFVNIDPEKELSIFYAQHMLNSDNYYMHSTIRNIVYAFLEEA